MRRVLITLVCSFLLTPLFSETKITYLSGYVSVFRDNEWIEAKKDMALDTLDRVKTGVSSKAVLTMDGTTRIWVSPNSQLQVSSMGQESVFGLLFGKVKAKVKLLSGRRFKVQTPVSVASVRGTEFISSSDGQLVVLEGTVEFADLHQTHTVYIGQGQIGILDAGGQVGAPRELTPQERETVNQEWQNFEQAGSGDGVSPEQPQSGRKQEQDTDLRNEFYGIASEMKNEIAQTRELTNEIKESDLSAGRTLKDVHGNLVRVEQHLLRPDNQSMEFLNLTKRSDYTYVNHTGRQDWPGYTAAPGPRLDVLDVKITMNKNLPDQLSEWPSYMASQGDAIHPQKVDVKITNQTDSLEFKGDWRLRGELGNDQQPLNDDGLVMESYINGYKVDESYNAPDSGRSYPGDGEEPDDLYTWDVSPQMKIAKDGDTRYVRLYNEGYVINNEGKILGLNTFTSTSDDPFTVLKQVAGEQIVFCREVDSTSGAETGDFFHGRNLDLVYTPDIVMAVAQKLATEMGDLTSSGNKTSSR